MKNSQLLFYIVIFQFLVVSSCQNKPAPTGGSTTESTEPNGIPTEKAETKIIEMTYESATVYAASTDYFFIKTFLIISTYYFRTTRKVFTAVPTCTRTK